MSIEAFRRAYAPERIGREWGFRSNDYATGRHRGLDVREQNEQRTASVETDVIAISPGVVDYIGRPSDALGPTVRIRRDAGGYEFHSHTIADIKNGTRTSPGTRLGRNARMSEKPGLIFGVHDHVVFSDYADGAWNTSRPTHDPYPFILRALAGVAASSGDAKPAQAAEPEIEDQEEISMFIVVIGKSWYLCLPKPGGGFHAVAQPGNPDRFDDHGANKRIPVKNFSDASPDIRRQLAKVVDGLPGI